MQGQLLGKHFDMPRTPHGASWELHLPVWVRDYEHRVAQIMNGDGTLTPRGTAPQERAKSPAKSPAPESLEEDVQKQHSRLLVALGDHLEELGRTLSIYAAAERDVREAVKVVQPGTLRGLQGAISSLIRQDGNDMHSFASPAKNSHSPADGVQPESDSCKQAQPLTESCMEAGTPWKGNGVQAHFQVEKPAKLEKSSTGSRVGFALDPPEKGNTGAVNFTQETEESGMYSQAIMEWSATPNSASKLLDTATKPADQPSAEESKWKKWRVTMINEDLKRNHLVTFNRMDSDDSEGALSIGLSSHFTKQFSTGPKVGETVVSSVIIIYAIMLGISVDIGWKGWQVLEYFFTVFFLGELVTKLYMSGAKQYFIGVDCYWNIFDFAVVIITIVDSFLALFHSDTDLSIFTTVKIVRLGRLARLVRLLRFSVFKELKAMIMGVVSGVRVLLWAVFLFFSFIYVLAVVLRQNLGPGFQEQDANPQLKKAFETMGASMNTLFMCFTESCISFDGTPLQVHFYDDQGLFVVVMYMFTMLFVTIGLFNLIMAIFVDNVLEKGKQQKLEKRALERVRLERRLRNVVTMIQRGEQPRSQSTFWVKNTFFGKLINRLWEWILHHTIDDHHDTDSNEEVEDPPSITRSEFAELLEKPDMNRVLRSMEIETSSHYDLFDVLDADMSGELEYDELIVGLMSLRGPVEKKDIIGSLLCIRATQQTVREAQDLMIRELQRVATDFAANTDRLLVALKLSQRSHEE